MTTGGDLQRYRADGEAAWFRRSVRTSPIATAGVSTPWWSGSLSRSRARARALAEHHRGRLSSRDRCGHGSGPGSVGKPVVLVVNASAVKRPLSLVFWFRSLAGCGQYLSSSRRVGPKLMAPRNALSPTLTSPAVTA